MIALSGYALPEDLRRARQAGFDRPMAKPPSLEQIQIDDFIVKVHLFGFHFASLDLRQASDVFFATLRELVGNLDDVPYLTAADRLAIGKAESAQELPFELLERMLRSAAAAPPERVAALSPLSRDTLAVLGLVTEIQRSNGELGLHRVVISHTRGPEDPMVVLVLAAFAGLAPRSACLDIVPLFESIQDLEASEAILGRLLESRAYRDVLAGRAHRQIVMMGFSDGTKDGGYLTANWSIRRAKRRLSHLGRSHGVRIIFFDGRGGPPARGGGNTRRFYRSRDSAIEQWETQLTIQGQTISSNFGSHDMARYHIEQLYTANIENLLDEGPWEAAPYPARQGAAEPRSPALTRSNRTPEQDPPPDFVPLLDELSTWSMEAYARLRDNPLLLEFLAERSPLPLFEHLTNASRPASRRASKAIELESLRAIPFVATWSVLKIQISGFYGLGSALDHVIASGREADLQRLYRSSRFFRALLDNTAMSLLKSRFDITAHLKRDERFSELWTQIRDEAVRVERRILRITHQPWLLANDPLIRASIRYREEIILPLPSTRTAGVKPSIVCTARTISRRSRAVSVRHRAKARACSASTRRRSPSRSTRPPSEVRFVAQKGALPKIEEVPGSVRELPADLVLLAMGFLGPEKTGLPTCLREYDYDRVQARPWERESRKAGTSRSTEP